MEAEAWRVGVGKAEIQLGVMHGGRWCASESGGGVRRPYLRCDDRVWVAIGGDVGDAPGGDRTHDFRLIRPML